MNTSAPLHSVWLAVPRQCGWTWSRLVPTSGRPPDGLPCGCPPAWDWGRRNLPHRRGQSLKSPSVAGGGSSHPTCWKASPADRSPLIRSRHPAVLVGCSDYITGVSAAAPPCVGSKTLIRSDPFRVCLPHRPFMALLLLAGSNTLAGQSSQLR